MADNIPAQRTDAHDNPAAATRPQTTSRRKLRLAAIGSIAVAIIGGGVTAVASASTPSAVAAPTTSTIAPSSGASAPNSATPPAAPTHKPHMEGTVTSVNGSTVLIKDWDGFTRTIVVSSKTTYTDGLKAALATGTKIHAEGTVDANGTSLDATTIGSDKGGSFGGPGGGQGRRGPGGDHDGPPAGRGQGGSGPGQSGTGTKSAPTTSSAAPTTS